MNGSVENDPFYSVPLEPEPEIIPENKEISQNIKYEEQDIFKAPPQVKKVKKKVSAKQLEHLAKAREKAAATRRANKGKKKVTIANKEPEEEDLYKYGDSGFTEEPILSPPPPRARREVYHPDPEEQEDYINKLVEKKLKEREEKAERKRLETERKKAELREAYEAGLKEGGVRKEKVVKENIATFKQTWGGRFAGNI